MVDFWLRRAIITLPTVLLLAVGINNLDEGPGDTSGGSPDHKRSVEGQKKRRKPQGVVTPGSASPADRNTSGLYILIASGGKRRPRKQ